MAKKVVYVALDERPCNYEFPIEMFKESDINLIVPDLSIMGQKKHPADYQRLKEFLLKETKDAFGLVISIDTLLYGGIVPSRLHYYSKEELDERLMLLNELKNNNLNLKIFAFQLIMRCPQYNSSDEEPPYYSFMGREIYLSGYYLNKQELEIITEEEKANFEKLKFDQKYLDDFLFRRNLNGSYNIKTLDLLEENIIDFLIIPQDDASEYGYTAIDQEKIRQVIRNKKLMFKAYMYPGADEVGCILVSRMLNASLNHQPAVYVKYPSVTTPMVVPCLEDRYLDTTIRYQILAAGGIVVPSLADADIVLIALCGATKMIPNPSNIHSRDIDVLCNLPEIIVFAKWAIEKGYPVIIADLFYLNGGSFDVLSLIESAKLTMELASYSGWNTSSNALGTAIAQGIMYYHYGKTKSHLDFLVKRYIEDIGYCSYARELVTKELHKYDMDYFNVKATNTIASELVAIRLNEFVQNYLKTIKDDITITEVTLPWKRMFELAFKIKYKG